MTVTTAHGTILATFKKQVPEIDLLVEERDSVTLDVRQYEPFVNDPPVLKVDKHNLQKPVPTPSVSTSIEPAHRPEPPMDSTSQSQDPSMEPETSIPSPN